MTPILLEARPQCQPRGEGVCELSLVRLLAALRWISPHEYCNARAAASGRDTAGCSSCLEAIAGALRLGVCDRQRTQAGLPVARTSGGNRSTEVGVPGHFGSA